MEMNLVHICLGYFDQGGSCFAFEVLFDVLRDSPVPSSC